MKTNQCILGMAALIAALMVSCGGGSSGNDSTTPLPPVLQATGSISGNAVSARNGAVEIVTTANVVGMSPAVSNGTQPFTLNNVPVGDRVVVRLSAPGHMDQIKVVAVRSGLTTQLRGTLIPLGVSDIVNPSSVVNVTVPGSSAQVNAPANALVRSDNGAAPTGSLTVALTHAR
jgi:hypothetical protein